VPLVILAAASSVETYGGEGGKVAVETAEKASALPTTGLELALIFGVALILFGTGMLLAKLN
jgi:hypothetical protein